MSQSLTYTQVGTITTLISACRRQMTDRWASTVCFVKPT